MLLIVKKKLSGGCRVMRLCKLFRQCVPYLATWKISLQSMGWNFWPEYLAFPPDFAPIVALAVYSWRLEKCKKNRQFVPVGRCVVTLSH